MSDTPPTRKEKRQRQKEGAQARRAAQVAALRRRQRNRRLVRIGVAARGAVGLVLLISALGGDDGDDPVATDDIETTTTTEGTTTTAAPIAAEPIECAPPTGENTDMTAKPAVPVPDEPVTELQCTDLVEGDGEEVLNLNDTVQVQYVGVSQSTGEEFDSSWDRGEPATFNLQGVIEGWTTGIPGMKVGGRRVLTIPADLAYGDQGEPSGTLVFVIDLLAVNPS